MTERLPHALFHLVKTLAKSFTDRKMLGLSRRAEYKNFRTMYEQMFDKFFNCFQLILHLRTDDHTWSVETLKSWSTSLLANSQYLRGISPSQVIV